MAQDTYINGTRYAFSNFSALATAINAGSNALNGGLWTPPKGVMQAFDWEAKQDSAEVEGNQVAPVGVTDGYGKGTGSYEILYSESDDHDSAISSGGAFPLMSCFTQWMMGYSINDIDVTTVLIQGLKITGITHNAAKGSEPATVKYTYRCSRIVKNGVVLFGDSP